MLLRGWAGPPHAMLLRIAAQLVYFVEHPERGLYMNELMVKKTSIVGCTAILTGPPRRAPRTPRTARRRRTQRNARSRAAPVRRRHALLMGMRRVVAAGAGQLWRRHGLKVSEVLKLKSGLLLSSHDAKARSLWRWAGVYS